MKHKHIDNIGRVIVDSLLLVILIAVVALPAASMGIIGFKNGNSTSVLSKTDKRVDTQKYEETHSFRGEDENVSSSKSVRILETDETEDVTSTYYTKSEEYVNEAFEDYKNNDYDVDNYTSESELQNDRLFYIAE